MKPIIIAHRGNNFSFPENTLSGLRSSFELGCLAVEFDIQMTNDETLVVMHDDNALRTSGIEQSVLDSSYEELTSVSVHEPKRLGEKHQPTLINKLSEVLELLNEFQNTHAYIEVKEESLEKWGHQEVIDQLLPIVKPFAKQCTIISFDLPVLDLIREQSDLAIGWVLYNYDEESLTKANASKPDYLVVDQAEIALDTPPWAGIWKWMVYGVDSAELALQHYNNGVEYIETDFLEKVITDNKLAG
jgi:glycerophosphoryl diester phosphodiesterase